MRIYSVKFSGRLVIAAQTKEGAAKIAHHTLTKTKEFGVEDIKEPVQTNIWSCLMKLKPCTKCGNDYPEEMFPLASGSGKRRPICRNCHSKTMAKMRDKQHHYKIRRKK